MENINVCKDIVYKIVARYMEGVKVVGYHLIDNYGQSHKLDKDTVERMALNKEIVNCTAQKYHGEIIIKGVNCKLSDLPVIDVTSGKVRGVENKDKKNDSDGRVSLIGRITSGKETVEYIIRDSRGNTKNVKRDDVLKLARDKKIVNARAQVDGNTMILRGVGFDLVKLPVYKIKG